MSNYSPIYNSIWSDSRFSEYEPEKQLLFLFLITNSECKISGIYQITIKQISFSTNLDKDKIKNMLNDFDKNVLEYDFENGIIFLKNYFKYKILNGGNPNTLRETIIKNNELAKHDIFWKDFYKIYEKELKNKFNLLSLSSLNRVRVESGSGQGEATVKPPFINNRDSNNNNVNNNNSNSNKCAKNSHYNFIKKKLATFNISNEVRNQSENEREDYISEYSEGLKDFSIDILTEIFEIMRLKNEWFPDLGTLKKMAYERTVLHLEKENPQFKDSDYSPPEEIFDKSLEEEIQDEIEAMKIMQENVLTDKFKTNRSE